MTTVSVPKQGQSASTEYKERGLQAAFTINLRVFASKFSDRYRYWHFDLNSGSGYNEKVGCIGSPIAFLNAVSQFEKVRYFAGFCDINESALKELGGRDAVAGNRNVYRFHGNNASLIDAIPYLINAEKESTKHAMGMVLSDPNGYETPIEQLAALAKECQSLDISLHWNSRIRKLYRGQGWQFVDIDEAISQVGKRHWLIREPLGANQWTVLIGRNVRIGDHRALGYHHLESKRGQDILRRCKARIDGGKDPDAPLQMAMGF